MDQFMLCLVVQLHWEKKWWGATSLWNLGCKNSTIELFRWCLMIIVCTVHATYGILKSWKLVVQYGLLSSMFENRSHHWFALPGIVFLSQPCISWKIPWEIDLAFFFVQQQAESSFFFFFRNSFVSEWWSFA
jgi:hypothetical protein